LCAMVIGVKKEDGRARWQGQRRPELTSGRDSGDRASGTGGRAGVGDQE
jgi:hypothetical protein